MSYLYLYNIRLYIFLIKGIGQLGLRMGVHKSTKFPREEEYGRKIRKTRMTHFNCAHTYYKKSVIVLRTIINYQRRINSHWNMFYTTFYTISTKYIFSNRILLVSSLIKNYWIFSLFFFSFRYILIPRTVISNRIYIIDYSVNIWIFRRIVLKFSFKIFSYQFISFATKS